MSDARIKAVIRSENNENLIAIKIKTSPVNSINRWPASHEIIERTFITGSTNIYKSRIDSNNNSPLLSHFILFPLQLEINSGEYFPFSALFFLPPPLNFFSLHESNNLPRSRNKVSNLNRILHVLTLIEDECVAV